MVMYMNEKNLIDYYNKFNEDKRLTRRHGIVEYQTTMKYISQYISKIKKPKVIDIGAGTGKYSIALAERGCNVVAVDLIKHNLMTLKTKTDKVKTILGNAINLHMFEDNTFDLVLLFGPMYHLITEEEKIRAIKEAKRITKKGGIILISYYMNEYAILTEGFKNNNIKNAIQNNLVDEFFHVAPKKTDLYSMVRIEDIDRYREIAKLKRIKIIAQDGPSDYMRPILNQMDEETFNLYIKYHQSICERPELLGASSHVLDILKKE